MKIITTKSFHLAVYARGAPNAQKLALVLPGRLDTKDYVHMRSAVDFLSSKGCYALSFDPPGTWESPGDIDLFTTSNYLNAVNELIEHFGARPTLLFGHSRGGTITMLASAHPSVEAIVMAMATYGKPSSPKPGALATGFQIEKRNLPPGDRRGGEQRTFLLPLNYFDDGKKFDPVAMLEQCIKPKLHMYGTQDEFTTVQRVREVFEALPEPKMLYELQTDHDYRYYPKAIEEVNVALGNFLDTFLASPGV